MVITAYEDLQQFEGAFTQSLCPEFNNIEAFLDNNGIFENLIIHN